jgi:hypothetical protein
VSRPVVVGVAAPPPVVTLRRQRRGPSTGPFEHGVDCKTPDADPQSHELEPHYWTRICSCSAEYHRTSPSEIEPSSEAARPSWRAHGHACDCEHSNVAVVVKVDKHPDGGWRSECVSCGTIWLYWYDPEHWERQPDGSMIRVTGRGSVRFAYELASDDV